MCFTILILLGIFSRRSEDRRQEVEMLLDTQNETIADLTRRVSTKHLNLFSCYDP